jgi:glutaredoxin
MLSARNLSKLQALMSSIQQRRVVLYTRAGCHLCDEAEETLIAHGLEPVKIDVDADPSLREKFDECVPVVELDGKIRFRGRVDPVLLRRLLP